MDPDDYEWKYLSPGVVMAAQEEVNRYRSRALALMDAGALVRVPGFEEDEDEPQYCSCCGSFFA